MAPTNRHRSAAEELADATGEPVEAFDPGDEYEMPSLDELEIVDADVVESDSE